jgi:hypothetical protein
LRNEAKKSFIVNKFEVDFAVIRMLLLSLRVSSVMDAYTDQLRQMKDAHHP